MLKPMYDGDGSDLRDVDIPNEWDDYHNAQIALYRDGFEDGIRFWFKNLCTTYVNSIDIREYADTLARLRKWKSADEWKKLIEDAL